MGCFYDHRISAKFEIRVENKEISGATVRNYVKPIRLFCEMNEVFDIDTES